METEDTVAWSNLISISVTTGEPVTLSRYGLIESILRVMYGPRAHDERAAFKYLGGLGFSARRRARRQRLWADAVGIAECVGHGEEQEPMRVFPNQMVMPIGCVADVKRLFGETGG